MPDVASTDAGADPWAMVIVDLDAKITVVTMETPRWSNEFATHAVRQLPWLEVLTKLFNFSSIGINFCRQVFKFLQTVKLLRTRRPRALFLAPFRMCLNYLVFFHVTRIKGLLHWELFMSILS
jgi:hypothetical protein